MKVIIFPSSRKTLFSQTFHGQRWEGKNRSSKDGSKGSPEFFGTFGVLQEGSAERFHTVKSLLKKASTEPQKFCRAWVATPSARCRSLPGPLGPESRKSLRRVSLGLPAPGSKKCPKQSRNSLQSLKIDCFETPETVLRLFRTLFGPQGRKVQGDSFDSFGIPGPESPGDSCKGRAGLQSLGRQAQLFRLQILLPLEGPTRKPRHASAFSTHSETRKRIPHSTGYECFKAFFRHAVYKC